MDQWNRMYLEVSEILNTKLPVHLTYHNWYHTFQVLNTAELIAKEEKVPEADILLLKIAALFHDIGFINGIAKNHEETGIAIAKDIFKKYSIVSGKEELIYGLIRATIIPQRPQNHLEEILADADLDYLGTHDFERKANILFQEITHDKPDLKPTEWNESQIRFLQEHHYFTDFSIRNRAPVKAENLRKLLESGTKRI